jgi:hypothetical protein
MYIYNKQDNGGEGKKKREKKNTPLTGGLFKTTGERNGNDAAALTRATHVVHSESRKKKSEKRREEDTREKVEYLTVDYDIV